MKTRAIQYTAILATWTILVTGLFMIARENYVLFHSVAEIFRIVIAFSVFLLTWNTRHLFTNRALLLLGIALLAIGMLDVGHLLVYKGIGIFPSLGPDPATQLWIAMRYLESVTFVLAAVLMNRPIHSYLTLSIYLLLVGAITASIFVWKVFPSCFISGQGLTPCKVVSEYLIAGIFALGFILLWRRRHYFEMSVFARLSGALVTGIFAEIVFTAYTDPYGFPNFLGHILIIISSYLIYKALVETGLRKPYDLLFHSLKLREEELRESEERFRTTFEHAAAGIAQVDLDGRWLRVNQRLCAITGYSAEELHHRRFQDITHPDDLHVDLALAEQLRTGEIPAYSMEKRYLRKDGTSVWVMLTGSLLRDTDGKPKHFIAVVEDITPRKKMEAEFQRLLEQARRTADDLERERAFLSSAIDIIPIPLLFVSPTRDLLRANSAATDFFPDANPSAWKNCVMYTPKSHATIPLASRPLLRALTHGEVISSFEAICALPDTREVPVLLHAAPVRIGDDIVAAIEIIQDVTELKEADRAKDDFLAFLSHELLTPVTSMLGWTQLAQGMENPPQTQQALEVIERNCRRQQRLVDDLLDISRITHRKLAIKPERVNLWQIAIQCLESIEQTANKRGIALQIDAQSTALPVVIDPTRATQVIANLLNNAMKFTESGGTITLHGRQIPTGAIIAIEDTGKGIPADKLTTIFQPFQQLTRDKRSGGLGLGLALVKGLVELHHGQVSVESAGEGCGSTFTITLPLATDADNNAVGAPTVIARAIPMQSE